MSLKNEKINMIKQYAFEQFQRHGFTHVTMDEIAKETNTGKGTLYRYFPSKEELLMAAIEKNITEIEKKLHLELSDEKDSIEKLNCYIELISILLKSLHTSQLLDIERSVPQAYQLICEGRERIIFKTLASILEEGKENDVFREDLDTNLVVKIIIGASEYITSPRVLDTLQFTSLSDVMKKIFNTTLLGCYSEEGRKKARNF